MNKDIIEENEAAIALANHITDRPIVGTSGDASHRLNPISIKLRVGLSEKGDELAISVMQTDRHHPHLVYDTITKHLGELEELKGYNLKPIQPERDYDLHTGRITVRYDLPSGVADSVIHKLTERVKQPAQAIPVNPIDAQMTAIDTVVSYFNRQGLQRS